MSKRLNKKKVKIITNIVYAFNNFKDVMHRTYGVVPQEGIEWLTSINAKDLTDKILAITYATSIEEIEELKIYDNFIFWKCNWQ
ncbi:hypothetical protein [Pseudomonas orientalis]|uniref:Uncharacterized protein n=1 Tax=Pseudomonas orientalis TaxID=76758 RepID=A0A2L0RTA8_9PSED|nr:hypothetical protein [Pseudomonas orientalis]AUZ45373.1 hypothetical protein BOP93_07100 [Pseudomonas orientalis]